MVVEGGGCGEAGGGGGGGREGVLGGGGGQYLSSDTCGPVVARVHLPLIFFFFNLIPSLLPAHKRLSGLKSADSYIHIHTAGCRYLYTHTHDCMQILYTRLDAYILYTHTQGCMHVFIHTYTRLLADIYTHIHTVANTKSSTQRS